MALEGITEETTLMNPDTPQGLAFLWLEEIDPLQVDPCTSDQLEQRYILATFYYATNANGSSWTSATGWLTEADECSWMGVTCQGGQVSGIELRTCLFCSFLYFFTFVPLQTKTSLNSLQAPLCLFLHDTS